LTPEWRVDHHLADIENLAGLEKSLFISEIVSD
jgi:hypothetical protein